MDIGGVFFSERELIFASSFVFEQLISFRHDQSCSLDPVNQVLSVYLSWCSMLFPAIWPPLIWLSGVSKKNVRIIWCSWPERRYNTDFSVTLLSATTFNTDSVTSGRFTFTQLDNGGQRGRLWSNALWVILFLCVFIPQQYLWREVPNPIKPRRRK